MFKVNDKVICKYRLPHRVQWWVSPLVWVGQVVEILPTLFQEDVKVQYPWGAVWEPVAHLKPSPWQESHEVKSAEEVVSIEKLFVEG